MKRRQKQKQRKEVTCAEVDDEERRGFEVDDRRTLLKCASRGRGEWSCAHKGSTDLAATAALAI